MEIDVGQVESLSFVRGRIVQQHIALFIAKCFVNVFDPRVKHVSAHPALGIGVEENPML